MKRCTKCSVEKPLDQFYRQKGGTFGVRNICIDCSKAYKKKYYADNRDRLCAEWRENYASNAEFSEKKRAYRRKYYKENTQLCLDRSSDWRAKNPDKHRESKKRWKENNWERVLKNARINDGRRRARKARSTSLKFSADQLADRWDYYGCRCYLCGDEATQTDHVKPLSKGGANMLCNLRPICADCNNRKNNRWPYPVSRGS